MLTTSIQVKPYIYNIDNTTIFFGLDLESGFYWVADYNTREVVSGDLESMDDAEGTAYEFLFNYTEQELLNV
jgi:hypothetical protein